MTDNAIELTNLTRTFGTLAAVNEISLSVPTGSIFGFLGPNGAGKTTTIRLLLGLMEPSSGSARVLGYDTRREADAIRQRCGALLEHTGLYERLTALDNLNFYGSIYHIPPAERGQRTQTLLKGFGLWDKRLQTVSTWSRGMKQKLAIARAMLHKPELLFLDEPTAGLDPVAAAELRQQLMEMAARHQATIFLTTHNLDEAQKICSQVGVVRAGSLLMHGSPDELRMSRGDNRIWITARGLTPVLASELKNQPGILSIDLHDQHLEIRYAESLDSAAIVQTLVLRGVSIDEVRKGKSSLEEVFITLMEENHDQ